MITRRRDDAESTRPSDGSNKLLLGWEDTKTSPIGFRASGIRPHSAVRLVEYDGDAPPITIAPTRSGKGVGVVVPNALNYLGPLICVDPKGEAYMAAARRRAQFGPVVKLDPFGVLDGPSDRFNAHDLFSLSGADLESDSQAMADLLARGMQGTKEPFWDLNGTGFLSGLLAYTAGVDNPLKRNLPHVIERLSEDDVVYNLAVLLDTEGTGICPLARREIASFLQMPDVTRGGVLATVQSYLKAFMTPKVAQALTGSTFLLQDVVDGNPLSIFVIIPPDKLHSHRALLKLWIGTLMMAMLRRKRRPVLRTLVLLDEVAQLEHFPLLETMITLCAGFGVWVWPILQDLSQLKTHYPTSWKSILNNCGVVQTFGIYNRDMATQWSGYLDHGAHQLRSLAADEQIVAMHGQRELRCQRLNYLTDARFQGQYDANRFYTAGQFEGSSEPHRRPHPDAPAEIFRGPASDRREGRSQDRKPRTDIRLRI